MTEHTYLVRVGSVRGGSPQGVRENAIDIAVGDIPEAGGRYEVMPGYDMVLWNQDRHQDARGSGRFAGLRMTVQVTVPADQASWTAPGPEPDDDERDLAAEFRAFAGRLARTRIGDSRD